MTQTLPRVGHEHHEQLLRVIDPMPGIGDRILSAPADEVRGELDELVAFLTGTLIPHAEAAERALYPELERMLQNRHSMSPMRREHEAVRRLVNAIAELAIQYTGPRVPVGTAMRTRRAIFQLYALLKIHLAEEEAYLRIVDHGVAKEVADLLAAAMDHPGFTKT